MKHLFFLMVLTALLAACKKDKQLASLQQTPAFKKNLIELNMSNGLKKSFAYNNAGFVVSSVTNYTLTTYQQQQAFELNHKYNSSGSVYELKNTVRNAANKIISADQYYNGTLRSKVKYTYNGEGYLIKTTWQRIDIVNNAELNFFYEGGNLMKITDYSNGHLNNVFLYEYDLTTANPFKIDWYEQMQTGYVTDEQFGKFSKNILKRETRFDENGVIGNDIQFKFSLDAEGYPISMEETSPSYSIKYSFKFQ